MLAIVGGVVMFLSGGASPLAMSRSFNEKRPSVREDTSGTARIAVTTAVSVSVFNTFSRPAAGRPSSSSGSRLGYMPSQYRSTRPCKVVSASASPSQPSVRSRERVRWTAGRRSLLRFNRSMALR